MVKKTLFKYSSVLLSVVLIASTLTGCGTSTAYNQTGSEVAISSEAASNTENIITNAIKNELSNIKYKYIKDKYKRRDGICI